jgi:predicted PurR-regulated permease PerM
MDESRKLVLFAAAILLLAVVGYYVRHALLLIYISIVFAIVLTPLVQWVYERKIFGWRPSRAAALLLIIGIVVSSLTIFLVLALPPLIRDLQQLATQLPERLEQLRDRFPSVPAIQRINLQSLQENASSLASGLTGIIGNVANMFVSGVTVAVLTSYLILEGESLFGWVLTLFPFGVAQRLEFTLERAALRMRKWLVGQAMLMLILGSASVIVFGLLGIRYFYLLGVFAGISNIIPLLGPILTIVLATLVASFDSLGKVIGVLVFYFVYQQIENAYLTPRIMKAQVELSSTAILVSLLIGSEIAGFAGALVSVPTAVLVSVLIHEYLARRTQRQKIEEAAPVP